MSTSPGNYSQSAGSWATVGAAVAAVLSSACCWIPLLLIGVGASAAGVAGFFEAYRPYLLAATVLLLAVGFYLVYFHKPRCGPDAACAVPKSPLTRFNKVMLWVASGVVLLFSFFPNYVGVLVGSGGADDGTTSAALSGESRTYQIEGMTCEGCATHIKASLVKIPGVARVELTYAVKRAWIFFADKVTPPSDDTIQKAIEAAGYRGHRIEK